jgi:hypothetical protein
VDSLTPGNVPVYDSPADARELWNRYRERQLPVVAVRAARRGFVVHYDLQHLGVELTPGALQSMRDTVLAYRRVDPGPDSVSQVERVGGEMGPVSGALHEETETAARRLASYLAETVFDRSNWV